MKHFWLFSISIILLLSSFLLQSDFLTEQKKYERVRASIREKDELIKEILKKNELKADRLNLLMVAYKVEGKLELFGKNKDELTYKKIGTYAICSSSGELGPKRKMGDYQVPEGFYHIDRFNPSSNFYLSLGINYPNHSDKRLSKASNLGGDIFIHGSCVSIGCLPMTDDKIKELYLYAIYAKSNGQHRIPVYIFPYRMTKENIKNYQLKYEENQELIRFWKNIQIGYEKFEKERKELNFKVDESGNYLFY